MDEIRIENLEIYAGHGVLQEENRTGQPFFINMTLHLDLQEAGKRDDLTKSVHYGEVSYLVNDFLKKNTFQLLEAAAEQTAREVLLRFPLIRAVDLEVKKPRAPIGLPFGCVSVKISRGWKQAFLGIGSNMGDKEAYLKQAIQRLSGDEEIRNLKCSPLIETEPYGGVEQDFFLNGVIGLETLKTPWELLSFLQQLEKEAGRVRTLHWGPRTLDLDLLLFEDFLSDDPKLTVPHPDMENRYFVLQPLARLCPSCEHPVLHKSVKQLLAEWERQNGKNTGKENRGSEK